MAAARKHPSNSFHSFHTYLIQRQKFESLSSLMGASPRLQIRSPIKLKPALDSSLGQHYMTQTINQSLSSSSFTNTTTDVTGDSSSSSSLSWSSFSYKIMQFTQCLESSTIYKSERVEREMKKFEHLVSSPYYHSENVSSRFKSCGLRKSSSLNELSCASRVHENKQISQLVRADNTTRLLVGERKQHQASPMFLSRNLHIQENAKRSRSYYKLDLKNHLYLESIPEEA